MVYCSEVLRKAENTRISKPVIPIETIPAKMPDKSEKTPAMKGIRIPPIFPTVRIVLNAIGYFFSIPP